MSKIGWLVLGVWTVLMSTLVAVATATKDSSEATFATPLVAPVAPAVSFNFVYRGAGKELAVVPLFEECDGDQSCIGPMTPPTNEKLFNLIFRGIGVTEWEIDTDFVTDTPAAVFATDLPSAQRNDSYTQEVLIRNTSSDFGGTGTELCVAIVAWSGVSTCDALCGVAAFDCAGTVTDGKVIPPGGELPRTFNGTACICAIGDAGGTAYQAERLVR